MKITVEGEAKEIADLTVALQGQPIFKPKCELSIPRTTTFKELKKCMGDTLSEVILGLANNDNVPKN